MIETKAIVLHNLKYGDNSIIVRMFTKERGLQSFMVKGIFKKTKSKSKIAYFMPFTFLKISYNAKNKSLFYLKNFELDSCFNALQSSLVKKTQILFLSEILLSLIKEELLLKDLYVFIESFVNAMNISKETSNFHLYFIVQLTKYLGFFPKNIIDNPQAYFDLQEGEFNLSFPKYTYLPRELNPLLTHFMKTSLLDIQKKIISRDKKILFLKYMIKYFELHLQWFKKPKSLQVLTELFN